MRLHLFPRFSGRRPVRPSRRPTAAPARLILLAALFLIPAMAVPAVAPADGLFEFTVKDERELGEKFYVLIRSKLPLVEDPIIVDYVTDMVRRIAAGARRQPFPLTVSVLRSNALNAFAAPAGHIFVFTGLLLHLQSESEIAGVLSHELAHVTQRHLAGRMEKMKYLSIAQLLGVAAGIATGVATGNNEAGSAMVFGANAATAHAYLGYSRTDEREADQVGMSYLTKAGYRVQGMRDAFKNMRRMKHLKGLGDIPTYMSTHPGIPERIGYLDDRIKRLPQSLRDRRDDAKRFKRVQTLVRARYTDPNYALAYYSRLGNRLPCLDMLGKAIAMGRTKHALKARPLFEKALKCGGDDPMFLREAGRYFLKIREFRKASTLLSRSLKKDPDDILSMFVYSRVLADEGRFPEAIRLMSRVEMRVPDDVEVHSEFGRILGRSGDLFGAHLQLSYAALCQNDPRKFKKQLEKAKALAKTPKQRQQLARLEKKHKKREKFWDKSIF